MCCFTGSVTDVQLTRIFARGEGGSQYLAYQMHYQAASELAMILPLPAPVGVAENAVRFIDLSGYAEFFTDAGRGFPWPVSDPDSLADLAAGDEGLKVHAVGSYEASFVPRLADFSRLDPRFRMPEGVWDKLPQYADWSFCVFRLREGRRKVHPMAFEFQRRDSSRLFFPTVHVHDGEVREVACFDHELYCQADDVLGPPWEASGTAKGMIARLGAPPAWRRSSRDPEGWREFQRIDGRKPVPTPYDERARLYLYLMAREPALPARDFMQTDKAQGLVDPTAPLFQRNLKGQLPNQDHYV